MGDVWLKLSHFLKQIKKEVKSIDVKLVTIDGSTQKTAITLFVNGEYREHTLLDFSKDKDMESRFKSMSKGMWVFLEESRPNIIYIEETYMSRNAQTMKILTRLQGVVYAWCMNNECEFNTILPSQWRKYLKFTQSRGTKRQQLKEQSIKYVLENYNLDVTDDEADAICIGDAVIKMFEN